jgi:acyl-CoA synthetase (AMP-forming)/AMP-acid ligase II
MPQASFLNLRQLLESRVERSPDRDFLFAEADGRIFTYREFDRAVNRAANLLLTLGVRKGDRVSLFLTNSAEYLIFYFACFKLGAWAGPINALLKSEEVEFVIADSQASVAVTQSDLYPTLAKAGCRQCVTPNWLRSILLVDAESSGIDQRVINYQEAIRDQPDELTQFDLLPDDEAVIIYTSGTTGKPKGVLLTHGNLLSNAQQIAAWLRLSEQDRALMVMPLFHVNALMTTGLAALWAGGQIVVAPRFSASRHWHIVSRYDVTYFGSVATMLSLLNQAHPHGLPEGIATGRLRFALCGSAPVPVEVMKTFESRFGCPVIEGYGLSEATCRSTFNPIDERRRLGSVGLPIGNEMKIFDEDDRELAPGQIGEIVLRGPNVMKGYYRNEEATRKAMRSGWLHTGDLGYRDEDGFFYVVDRKSDMIIRGGENIYPREIDEVLYQHPKIKDAATIGVPDPLYGEEVKSFVVLREGARATQDEIIEFCRKRLADFKCPKSIEFLDSIPKGPTGKLLKRELAARYSAEI